MPKKKVKVKAVTPEEKTEAELAKLQKKADAEAARLQAKGDETPSSESAPGDQTPSEEEETPPEGSDADGGDDAPTTEDDTPSVVEPTDEEFIENLKPKAQKRFKKLNAKAKEAENLRVENEKLKAQVGKPKAPDLPLSEPKTQPGTKFPWDSKPEGDGEEVLTQEQLSQQIQLGVRRGIQAEKQVGTFSDDVKSVEKDYPVLRAEDENFDEALATEISTMYEAVALVRAPNGGLVFKPNAPSFRTFVDKIMGIRTKAAEGIKKKVTTKVLKQAAKQPISPSGTPPAKGTKDIEAQIMDPETSLKDAEVLANKAAKRV